MLDRLAAGAGIGVGERAVFVAQGLAGGVREGVGVDGIEAEAQGIGLGFEVFGVGLVPGDMEGNGGRGAGQLVDDGAVFELVENVAGFATSGETGKAGAAGAHAP